MNRQNTMLLLSLFSILVVVFVGCLQNRRRPEGFEVVNGFEDVVVTLTTSPKRIAKIEPVIDSIMNQTSSVPYIIVLNLPFVYKRNNSTFGDIPDFLLNNSRVYINRCEDIGPATKVLPTVKIVRPLTILISIDDDIVYPEDTVATLLEMSRIYPEAAITGHSGMLLEHDDALPYRRDETKPFQLAELVEGHASVLYRREFLVDFDYDDILTTPLACYLGDDLILSNHLRKKNIPILVVDDIIGKIYGTGGILEYGIEEDAIHQGADHSQGADHDYESCAAHLRENDNLFIKHTWGL
jgi:hypothetical protein